MWYYVMYLQWKLILMIALLGPHTERHLEPLHKGNAFHDKNHLAQYGTISTCLM